MPETGKVPKTAKRPQPKGGSRKGIPNKTTGQIKEMILTALSNAGGAEYLERRANDPRTASAFLGLVGKVLPLQLANAEGESFVVTSVKRVIVDSRGTGN